MKSFRLLLASAAVILAGCAAPNQPYRMQSEPENTEWWRDSLDVYPEDVRQDPHQYDHTAVAWAGVIKQSEADDFGDGYMRIRTTFEHHYFDWEQNDHTGGPKYDLSPHGEGLFKTEWLVKKVDPEASTLDAQKYAAPGKLVLIYGVPKGVDSDGVVKLRYRFLRMIDSKEYSTGEFDYARFGQPVVYLK